MNSPCCVIGCDKPGVHDLQGSITVDRIGLEDSTVDAWICCEHLDRLSDPPYIYLTIVGREAAAEVAT